MRLVGRMLDEVRREGRVAAVPQRIILVRHAESIANKDESVYFTTPDSKHELSPHGIEQALQAGAAINAMLGAGESVALYHSPFLRAKQTAALIARGLGGRPRLVREDPRLREQEWGNIQTAAELAISRHVRAQVGRFYYRFATGESGADVYDRVASFLNGMWRDVHGGPRVDNIVIVSHGLTLRLLLTCYFRWSVDAFERLWNFRPAQLLLMTKQRDGAMAIATSPDVANIFEDFLEASPLPPGATSYNVLFERGQWSSASTLRTGEHAAPDMVALSAYLAQRERKEASRRTAAATLSARELD